jgi:hypothetical protein
MPVDERISVELHGSPWLRPVVAAAHAVAILVFVFCFGPGWLSLCGGLLLAASASQWWSRSGKGTAASKFDLAADGSCRWHVAGGTISGKLRGDTTALPGLIILRFDQSESRAVRSLVLPRGSMHGEDWRRLQVFLRWGVRFDAAAPTRWAGPS